MKITDPDVIKNSEKNLIEAVKDDLDPDAVKNIIEKKLAAAVPSSRGGEIIVHNKEVAFKLDFDIQLNGSLMFDRQGNHIPESDKIDDEEPGNPATLISEDFDDEPDPENKGHDKSKNEDIGDILEESREFWEPKKKS